MPSCSSSWPPASERRCSCRCSSPATTAKVRVGEPTRERLIRQGIAIVAWFAVLFIGANQYLFWSIDSAMCVYASAFALATLTYYAILVGLRPHHVVIWGAVFVAGLLPIWGWLGADRDALAMILLGLALILSGLLDQRLLARSFASAGRQSLETSHVGG